MPRMIQFIAGPGAGKTTCATYLFSRAKLDGFDVEFCREYAQQRVFKGDIEQANDGKVAYGQLQDWQNVLKAGVQNIITDTSHWLFEYYQKTNGKDMADLVQSELEKLGVEVYLVSVERLPGHRFNPKTRKQTYEESLSIDKFCEAIYSDFSVSADLTDLDEFYEIYFKPVLIPG